MMRTAVFGLAAWMLLAGTAWAAPPERIVSLAPNLTEILYDIGLGDRVAAVTDFCDYPPAARKKPKIGGFATPSLEAVVSKNPDMVVMTQDGNPREFAERLNRLGIRTYIFTARRVHELPQGIRDFGSALGAGKTAKKRANTLEKELQGYRQRARKDSNPEIRKVVFFVKADPPIVAGPGTLIDDCLNLLGLENIAADAPAGYPKYSIEMIVHRAPDVIFIGRDAHGNVDAQIQGLSKKLGVLEAVRKGRVYYTSDAPFRLGPRIVDGIREIARYTGRL